MNDLSIILLAPFISVIAYVYADIMTDPGMLLNGLYRWLDRKLYWPLGNSCSGKPIQWLFKPIIGCSICVAGQMALWIYPLYWVHWFANPYDPIIHFSFTCVAMYFVMPVKLFYQWVKNKTP